MYRYDAFLSHSHEDVEIVQELSAKLKLEGLNIWFDQRSILPGQMFQLEMAKGIEQSKSCVVCLASNKPISNPNSWFNKEIQYALNYYAKNQGYRIIPVLLPTATLDIVHLFYKIFHMLIFERA